MKHLQTAAIFFTFGLSTIAFASPMPNPLKGAILLAAFWLAGANIGCIIADRGGK